LSRSHDKSESSYTTLVELQAFGPLSAIARNGDKQLFVATKKCGLVPRLDGMTHGGAASRRSEENPAKLIPKKNEYENEKFRLLRRKVRSTNFFTAAPPVAPQGSGV
jgi:hypothetical protein